VNLAILATQTNFQPRLAAMLNYINDFLSGGVEPFWPHVALLSFSVAASVAVGAGIIFEGPKFSASIHRIAFWLVVVGIAVEALCTIFLFVFDEGISNAQQSKIDAQQLKIIALETRLAPRALGKAGREKLAASLKRFAGQKFSGVVARSVPDASNFWSEVVESLSEAKWQLVLPAGDCCRPLNTGHSLLV